MKYIYSFVCVLAVPTVVYASTASTGGYDWFDLFLRIVNFVIVGVLLYIFAGRRVRTFFKERREGIAQEFVALHEQKKHVENMLRQAEKQKEQISEERERTLALAQQEATLLKERILQEASVQAEALIQHARKMAEAEVARAKVEIIKEITEGIIAEASEKVRSSNTEQFQKNVFNNSLAKVVELEDIFYSKALR